jgi:hypothetical protein
VYHALNLGIVRTIIKQTPGALHNTKFSSSLTTPDVSSKIIFTSRQEYSLLSLRGTLPSKLQDPVRTPSCASCHTRNHSRGPTPFFRPGVKLPQVALTQPRTHNAPEHFLQYLPRRTFLVHGSDCLKRAIGEFLMYMDMVAQDHWFVDTARDTAGVDTSGEHIFGNPQSDKKRAGIQKAWAVACTYASTRVEPLGFAGTKSGKCCASACCRTALQVQVQDIFEPPPNHLGHLT